MKQFLLIIEGPMGSGKTTIGDILHTELKRTALVNTAHIKNFVSDFESNPEDNAMTAAVMFAMCEEYVKQGISLLLPQAFWQREFVEPYIKLAGDNEIPFLMYQLEAGTATLRERVSNRPKHVDAAKMEASFRKWEENRYELGKILNTDELSANEAAQIIRADIDRLA